MKFEGRLGDLSVPDLNLGYQNKLQPLRFRRSATAATLTDEDKFAVLLDMCAGDAYHVLQDKYRTRLETNATNREATEKENRKMEVKLAKKWHDAAKVEGAEPGPAPSWPRLVPEGDPTLMTDAWQLLQDTYPEQSAHSLAKYLDFQYVSSRSTAATFHFLRELCRKNGKETKGREVTEKALKSLRPEIRKALEGDVLNPRRRDDRKGKGKGKGKQAFAATAAPAKGGDFPSPSYNCGETGHMKQDCKKKPKGGGGPGRKPGAFCGHCKKRDSHTEDECWEKHPDKRPEKWRQPRPGGATRPAYAAEEPRGERPPAEEEAAGAAPPTATAAEEAEVLRSGPAQSLPPSFGEYPITDPRYQGSEDHEHAGMQPHLLDEPKVGPQREVRVHRPEPFEVVTGNAHVAWARACSVRLVQVSLGQPLRCRGGAGPRASKIPEAEEEERVSGEPAEGEESDDKDMAGVDDDRQMEPVVEPTEEQQAVHVIPIKYRYYPPAQLPLGGEVYLSNHIDLMEKNFRRDPTNPEVDGHLNPGWLKTQRWFQFKRAELEAYVLWHGGWIVTYERHIERREAAQLAVRQVDRYVLSALGAAQRALREYFQTCNEQSLTCPDLRMMVNIHEWMMESLIERDRHDYVVNLGPPPVPELQRESGSIEHGTRFGVPMSLLQAHLARRYGTNWVEGFLQGRVVNYPPGTPNLPVPKRQYAIPLTGPLAEPPVRRDETREPAGARAAPEKRPYCPSGLRVLIRKEWAKHEPDGTAIPRAQKFPASSRRTPTPSSGSESGGSAGAGDDAGGEVGAEGVEEACERGLKRQSAAVEGEPTDRSSKVPKGGEAAAEAAGGVAAAGAGVHREKERAKQSIAEGVRTPTGVGTATEPEVAGAPAETVAAPVPTAAAREAATAAAASSTAEAEAAEIRADSASAAAHQAREVELVRTGSQENPVPKVLQPTVHPPFVPSVRGNMDNYLALNPMQRLSQQGYNLCGAFLNGRATQIRNLYAEQFDATGRKARLEVREFGKSTALPTRAVGPTPKTGQKRRAAKSQEGRERPKKVAEIRAEKGGGKAPKTRGAAATGPVAASGGGERLGLERTPTPASGEKEGADKIPKAGSPRFERLRKEWLEDREEDVRCLPDKGEDPDSKAALDAAGYPPCSLSLKNLLMRVCGGAVRRIPREREMTRTRRGLRSLVAWEVFRDRGWRYLEGPPTERPVWLSAFAEVRESPSLRKMLDEIGAPPLPRARTAGEQVSLQFEAGVRQAATAYGAVREHPDDNEEQWPPELAITEHVPEEEARPGVEGEGPGPEQEELPETEATEERPEGEEADTGVEFVPEPEAGGEQPDQEPGPETGKEQPEEVVQQQGCGGFLRLPPTGPAASFKTFDSFDTGVFIPPVVEAHLALAEAEPTAVTAGAEFLSAAPPPPPPPPIPPTGLPATGPAVTWKSVEETLTATLDMLYPNGQEESPTRKEVADAALFPPIRRSDAEDLLRAIMTDLRATYGTSPAVASALAADPGRVQQQAAHRMFKFRKDLGERLRQTQEEAAKREAAKAAEAKAAGRKKVVLVPPRAQPHRELGWTAVVQVRGLTVSWNRAISQVARRAIRAVDLHLLPPALQSANIEGVMAGYMYAEMVIRPPGVSTPPLPELREYQEESEDDGQGQQSPGPKDEHPQREQPRRDDTEGGRGGGGPPPAAATGRPAGGAVTQSQAPRGGGQGGKDTRGRGGSGSGSRRECSVGASHSPGAGAAYTPPGNDSAGVSHSPGVSRATPIPAISAFMALGQDEFNISLGLLEPETRAFLVRQLQNLSAHKGDRKRERVRAPTVRVSAKALWVNGKPLEGSAILDIGAMPLLIGRPGLVQLGLREEDVSPDAVRLGLADGKSTKMFGVTRKPINFTFNPGKRTETVVSVRAVVTQAPYDFLVGNIIMWVIGGVIDSWREQFRYQVNWRHGGPGVSGPEGFIPLMYERERGTAPLPYALYSTLHGMGGKVESAVAVESDYDDMPPLAEASNDESHTTILVPPLSSLTPEERVQRWEEEQAMHGDLERPGPTLLERPNLDRRPPEHRQSMRAGVNLRGISRSYPIPDGEPEWNYEAHPDGGWYVDEVPLWREGNRERLYWLIDFISTEGPSKYPAVREWEERRLQYRRDWLQRMILECRNEPMLAGYNTLPRRQDELAQIDSLFMMHAAYARDLMKEDALPRLDTEAVEFQTAATNNRRLAYPWEPALGPPVDAPAFNFNTRTAPMLEMELGALVGRAHSLFALLAQGEVRRFRQERTRELIAKHRRGLIRRRTRELIAKHRRGLIRRVNEIFQSHSHERRLERRALERAWATQVEQLTRLLDRTPGVLDPPGPGEAAPRQEGPPWAGSMEGYPARDQRQTICDHLGRPDLPPGWAWRGDSNAFYYRELHDFLEIQRRPGKEAQAESQNRAHVGDLRGEDYPQMADLLQMQHQRRQEPPPAPADEDETRPSPVHTVPVGA
ncbi:hypothetical protein KFL_008530020 [Klebsormidium nitens]|uniref:CCHC-type domain-containing protein n=1 Tax=Klebsormidium nitens TaxID=105231 RepID=A0A1Y1IRB2_KLENI|nr:hypothetical protein KFL_008530020 [Klebsormidium nitens]|eukprot:GAQ91781.1 hypothetical protein KFL_008530020 [Klebsormidium nitens]